MISITYSNTKVFFSVGGTWVGWIVHHEYTPGVWNAWHMSSGGDRRGDALTIFGWHREEGKKACM
jgi:hypothetical protein